MILFLFSAGNLLIILYKLTKFEAPSCYSYWNILITKFHYDPLQREIIHIKKNTGQLFLMLSPSMK